MNEQPTNEQQAQAFSEEQYKTAYNLLLKEITNLEEYKKRKMLLQVFRHSEGGKASIAILLTNSKKTLYKRFIEGDSWEVKYTALFFFYNDLLNNGLILVNQMAIEQDNFDKEKRTIEIVSK